MRFNKKEKKVLSIVIAIFGIFLIGSGLIMNSQVKPIIHTNYSVDIDQKKIAEAQAKTNEIKLKEIKIELNNPLSMDIKDYLENIDNLDQETLKSLKIDTSLVNINEAGTYQYTITYKKKKYLGTVIVKEKELPNVNFTLKKISIKTGESLSTNPKFYVNEEITDEILNNITLDLSQVKTQEQGDYSYYITYNNTKYQGIIEVRAPGPSIITPKDADDTKCPNDADKSDTGCTCKDNKIYDKTTNTCKDNSTQTQTQ